MGFVRRTMKAHQARAAIQPHAPGWRVMGRDGAQAIGGTKQVAQLKCITRPLLRSQNPMTKTSSALDALSKLAAKVDAVIQASPAAGFEKNARQHFVSQLARQGLVTREEYEIQTALLEKTRTKLKALETRIAELEAAHQSSPKK